MRGRYAYSYPASEHPAHSEGADAVFDKSRELDGFFDF